MNNLIISLALCSTALAIVFYGYKVPPTRYDYVEQKNYFTRPIEKLFPSVVAVLFTWAFYFFIAFWL